MPKLGLVFALSVAAIVPLAAQPDNHNGQVPVLLELFTSEGVFGLPASRSTAGSTGSNSIGCRG